MPKIKITEIDNTGLITREGLSNVVYIPGKSTSTVSQFELVGTDKAPADWPETYEDYYAAPNSASQLTLADIVPTFVSPVYRFDSLLADYIKVDTKPEDWDDNWSNYFTKTEDNELVKVEAAWKNGAEGWWKVVETEVPGEYEPIAPVEFKGLKAFDEAEGYNKAIPEYKIARKLISMGLPVLYEQIIADMTSTDWDKLTDKNQYDIRFLTAGTGSCVSKMITVAAKRGDCIALLHNSQETSATTVESIRTNIDSLLKHDQKQDSFAAAFTPWFTVDDDGLKDIIIPAEYGYLMAYAESIRNNPEWYAAAGSFRGIIPNIKDVMRKYSSAEVEQLQGRGPTNEVDLDMANDNSDFAINPITNVTPFGTIVWGNRTLLKPELDEVESVGILKATSFLNVRNLVSAVKKQLYITSKKYTFEQNSDVLWVNFKSGITPLLDQMQSGNGIVGYKIVKLPTNKKARLAARITIIPIEAVEDFELEVELTDSLEVIE